MIWFNCKKAREHLIKEGMVITCRVRRKSFGLTKAVFTNENRKREIIGIVKVDYIEESVDNQREHNEAFNRYYVYSGFNSAEEWKEEVRRLNNNRWMPVYLIFLSVFLEGVE